MLHWYCDVVFYSGSAYVSCVALCGVAYKSVRLMTCRDKLHIEMGLCCFVKIFFFKPFLRGFNCR